MMRSVRPLFVTIRYVICIISCSLNVVLMCMSFSARLEKRTWVNLGQSKMRNRGADNALAASASPQILAGRLAAIASETDSLNAHKRRLKVTTLTFQAGPLGMLFHAVPSR